MIDHSGRLSKCFLLHISVDAHNKMRGLVLLLLVSLHSGSAVDQLQAVMAALNSGRHLIDSAQHLNRSIPGVDPEADMTFCEICNYYGYGCEEYMHEVVTHDGFLLTMHRITGRKGSQKFNSTKNPIFMQHGLLADSTSFILNLPNESLPFLLSDAGFDVWLANSRGCTYSKAHKRLKPHQKAFWAWSWDEMAMYDLPASIDFVLDHTGHRKLYYIGHSQGTLIGFVHLSTSHTNKIIQMLAMAPVFNLAYMKGILPLIAPVADDIELFYELIGLYEFLPSGPLTHFLADYFCNEYSPFNSVCEDIVLAMVGVDVKQTNESRLPVYVSHTPAGTSLRNMMHFVQMYRSKECTRYDYGSAAANVLHYGTPTPPAYNISSIRNTPVTIYWAERDWLADPKDVHYIISNLRTLRSSIYIPNWDHLDFIWALDATTVIYNDIVKLLQDDLLH